MSERIRLSRARGWRKPAGAVVVARPHKYGNPFDWRLTTKLSAVRQYRVALLAGELPYSVADVRRELRGRPLACWCKAGEPCHADTLLEVANA